MLDTEKTFEKLEAEHPVLVFVANGGVTDVLIPRDTTPYELEAKAFIQINTDIEWSTEEAMELSTIALEECDYISIPFNSLFNSWEIRHDEF